MLYHSCYVLDILKAPLPPSLRSRFTELFVTEPTTLEDLRLVADACLRGTGVYLCITSTPPITFWFVLSRGFAATYNYSLLLLYISVSLKNNEWLCCKSTMMKEHIILLYSIMF